MPIHVANRRRSVAALAAAHPGAEIVDVTSHGPEPWVRMSPFYPHGGIPVPGRDDLTSQSVEGVWQALKVFQDADVDLRKLRITSMTGLKRTVAKYGPPRGHRLGGDDGELLGYGVARRRIYLPTYRWVLENHVADLVERLRAMPEVVLLDYTVNGDVDDLASPLSHAALIKRYADGDWPSEAGAADPAA